MDHYPVVEKNDLLDICGRKHYTIFIIVHIGGRIDDA